jgi:phosphoribosyl-ATP pyrophosphohydrolase
LVGLRSRDINLGEVMLELERRTSQSGLAEKAARPK